MSPKPSQLSLDNSHAPPLTHLHSWLALTLWAGMAVLVTLASQGPVGVMLLGWDCPAQTGWVDCVLVKNEIFQCVGLLRGF